MDYLDQLALLRPGSRRDLVGNRLALVAPAGSALQLKIATNFPLLTALNKERLALADPESVPAGRYAKQALTNLGVWSQVADRIVGAENVRGGLVLVARGKVATTTV